MNLKMQLVLALAEFCHNQCSPLPVKFLAMVLNAAGQKTGYGTAYKGNRGTYRLVHMTHRRLLRSGRAAEASMVAGAFTRPNGMYAF